MQSTLRRIQHSALHSATKTWLCNALALSAVRKRSADLMRTTMLHMLRVQLSKGWATWIRCLSVAAAIKLKQQRLQHSGHAALRTMRRTLGRITKRQLRRAFDTLDEHSLSMGAAKAKAQDSLVFLTKFVRRMLNVWVVGAWRQWKLAVHAEKNKARFLK
jgi:hypothetical protein